MSTIKRNNKQGQNIYYCIRNSWSCVDEVAYQAFFFIASLLTVNTLSNSTRFPTSEAAFLSSAATLATSSTTSSSTSPSTSSSTSSVTSTTKPIHVVEPLQDPNNDCEAVQPLYTIDTLKGESVNATFDVSCETEFFGGDFMIFYSPSVTTCIRGCAMFNRLRTQTENGTSGDVICSGVVYLASNLIDGNCHLKPVGYTSVVARKTNSTYAKLRLNN